jgi:hypothetical protein
MKESVTSLEKAAKETQLQVNKEKIRRTMRIFLLIRNWPYPFETVHSFTYVGSEVNCKNDVSAEIKNIFSANRCFHGLRKHFKSQVISRKTKMTLYEVLVDKTSSNICF